MTVPGEKGVEVLLAESVQKVERRVSRESLPLPIPFPENEVEKSERMRGLGRAVRSRVKRRVGGQGWANAGVRSMNGIFGKTATPGVGRLRCNSHPCHEFAMLIGRKALHNAVPPRKSSKRFAVQCLATLKKVLNRSPTRRVSFPCPTQVRRWRVALPS